MSEALVVNHRIFDDDPGLDPDYARNVRLNGSAYGLRAYVLTKSGDVFLTDPSLEEHLDFQRQHLADTDYPATAETINFDDGRQRVLDYPDHQPSVYYFDNGWADAYAARFPDQIDAVQRRWRAIRTMDDKIDFMSFVTAQGLDDSVPDYKNYEADTPRKFTDAPRPAYIKAPLSSNGMKNIRAATRRDIRRVSRGMPRFQVQQEIPHDVSLSSQYFIENGKIIRQLITGTIVNSDGSHAGNYTLPPEQQEIGSTALAAAAPVAEAVAEAGAEGYIGMDIVMARNGLLFYILECNPRPTFASYPWEMAERTGVPNWMSLRVKSNFNDLSRIDLGTALPYDSRTKTGLILFSVGQLALRKAPPHVEAWIAAPPEYQQEMADETVARFNIPAGKRMLAKAA